VTRHALLLLLVVLVLGACQDTAGSVTLAPGDPAVYAASVQPILEARCGTLDCHGDEGRALRLYSETGLRATDVLRDRPLTAAELDANRASIVALPAEELVDKPLVGRLAHEGGDLWLTDDANQVVCVRGWRLGEDASAACAAALVEPDVTLRDP
jgi:hypothetical protein